MMRQLVANISSDKTCLHVLNLPLVRTYQTSRRLVRDDCELNAAARISIRSHISVCFWLQTLTDRVCEVKIKERRNRSLHLMFIGPCIIFIVA